MAARPARPPRQPVRQGSKAERKPGQQGRQADMAARLTGPQGRQGSKAYRAARVKQILTIIFQTKSTVHPDLSQKCQMN